MPRPRNCSATSVFAATLGASVSLVVGAALLGLSGCTGGQGAPALGSAAIGAVEHPSESAPAVASVPQAAVDSVPTPVSSRTTVRVDAADVASGSVIGGTRVVLQGIGLLAVSGVQVGSTVVNVSGNSDTIVTFVTPEAEDARAGIVPITLLLADESSLAIGETFTYQALGDY